MKITKTIDVSHLSDQEIAAINDTDKTHKSLGDAKDLVRAVVGILRRPSHNSVFENMRPDAMADEIEKIAKAKGLL